MRWVFVMLVTACGGDPSSHDRDAGPDGGNGPPVGTAPPITDEIPTTGTIYYVAPNGDDAANGTTTPFRTLQKAANTVVAGDTVVVRAGTYAGFGYAGPGGSLEAPIRFKADPAAAPGSVVIDTPATG